MTVLLIKKKIVNLEKFHILPQILVTTCLAFIFMARNLRQNYFCVEIIACHAEQTKQNKASWRFILFNVNARPISQNHRKTAHVEPPPIPQNMTARLMKRDINNNINKK